MEIDWIKEGFGQEPVYWEHLGERYQDTDENRAIVGCPSRQEEAALRAKMYFNSVSSIPPKCIGGVALMSERDARLTGLILQCYMSGNDPFDVSVKKARNCPKKENNIGLIFKMYMGTGVSQSQLAVVIQEALAKEDGRPTATFDRKTVANRIKEYSWWDDSDWDVESKIRHQQAAKEMLNTVISEGRLRKLLDGK